MGTQCLVGGCLECVAGDNACEWAQWIFYLTTSQCCPCFGLPSPITVLVHRPASSFILLSRTLKALGRS